MSDNSAVHYPLATLRITSVDAWLPEECISPEQKLKSKSRHKRKHRKRNKSEVDNQHEKDNILSEQVHRGINESPADMSYGELADKCIEQMKQEEKEKRRRKKKSQKEVATQEEACLELSQQDGHKKYNRKKKFPESFAEGSTCDILEFLQTKIYILDDQSCSPNIKLPYPNQRNIARRQISKRTTDAIKGAIGVCDGVHTFEIFFNEKPWGSHCVVGVCSNDCLMYSKGYDHMVGNSPGSWVWDIPSQSLYHAGHKVGLYPGAVGLDIPRTFKMIIDREQRQLAFNIGLGNNVVFKDLPDSSVVLYPVISMVYGLAEVTVKVISSDLFTKYIWLPKAVSRTKRRACSLSGDEQLVGNEEQPKQVISEGVKHESSEKWAIVRPQEGQQTDEEEIGERNVGNKEGDDDRQPEQMMREDTTLIDEKSETVISSELSQCETVDHRMESVENIMKNDSQKENSEEEEDFDQESMRVENLDEDDQLLFHVVHGWDNTYKGSLIQPYPNAPHICVPLPNLVSRIQAVRCRRGFSGRAIHTWLIKELIVHTPSVIPEQMAYYRNNVIIGVATSEQRKYNFGYNIDDIGNEIWGLQYPDLMIHHGSSVYRPKQEPKNLHHINLDKYDFELSDGLEMTLNTVTNKLTFVHNGNILTELCQVKGEKLYPFVMYVKDAYYPLELNYVEGPKEYFDEILEGLGSHDKPELHHVRMIMKRSSSMKEYHDSVQMKDKYTWGCHSPDTEVPEKNTVCGPGIAVATYPLGGSRHKVKFIVEGSTTGFCIGFVHHDYPLQPVIQDTLPYLGNDLLSWCWDIDNKCLLHACKTIARYPADETFNPHEVTAYMLTLDFSPLGNNTASFTAHLDNDQPNKELGIAFISLPAKVLPTVVMKGNTQKLRMEYVSGPWKAAAAAVQTSEDTTVTDVKSEICTIF